MPGWKRWYRGDAVGVTLLVALDDGVLLAVPLLEAVVELDAVLDGEAVSVDDDDGEAVLVEDEVAPDVRLPVLEGVVLGVMLELAVAEAVVLADGVFDEVILGVAVDDPVLLAV